MAETIALAELVVIAILCWVVYEMNAALRTKRDERIQQSMQPIPSIPSEPQKPHTMTAKEIAVGNLHRQIQRRGKSWADIRARVESGFEKDPENDRAIRVEKFQGEN
jgi:hypothetical protein